MEFQKTDGKYVLTKSSHQLLIENQNIYGVNRLDPRCSIIPAHRRDIYQKNRFESERIFSLNGDYKFLHTENAENYEFFKTDFDDSAWDTLQVPSMWQYHGYGHCTYPNVRYHFPFDPPYIRCDNPVGLYRKKFNYVKDSERCILHFSGVISAYFIYLNSEYVGFAKGSRNASEFDVTDIIREGENTLAVKVYTWSDGSYLENQDMLNANGIFRDVYLIKTPAASVWDYSLVTDTEKITASVTVNGYDDTTVVRLSCNGEERTLPIRDGKVETVFRIDDPNLWTAETPNTYTVYIELYRGNELLEVHSKKVGLRKSETRGTKFLVNGKPVMLKGINRHEHNRKNGMAISDSQIEEEIKIIKKFNINAIRCSHYTNHPLFYELATEYGIYVMDESDMESHGAEGTGDQGAISKMKEWEYAYLYRTRCMIENNKNESCIVIWSIGNELGWGDNLKSCIDYIRSTPYSMPIHQSQCREGDDFKKLGYCTLAAMASMPTDMQPVVLTEYAHGMGNAPGALKDYWDFIYANEHYCGGFVWEFKSHGFYAEDENGTPFSKFGGDFSKDELNHWANFTIDGYIKSDLTPKPGLYELKEALSPVRVHLEDGKVICHNTNDFIDLSYLTLNWRILEDCYVLDKGELAMPAIAPRSFGALDIDTNIAAPVSGARYRIDLIFTCGEHEVSHKQVDLPVFAAKKPIETKAFEYNIRTSGSSLTITGNDFSVTFSDGLPERYEKMGKLIFDGKMKFNFFRATTDNDNVRRQNMSSWEANFMHAYRFTPDYVEVEEKSDRICLKSKGKATHQGLVNGFIIETEFSVLEGGLLLSEIHATPYGCMPATMLRAGVAFEMSKDFDTVTWYGRGDGESYCDRNLSAPFGLYEKNIKDMNFRYEVPQECGSRSDVSFATLSNGSASLNVIGSESFIFSYHDFTAENLHKAMHSNELKVSEKNYLYIDYAMRGLGNHSCGPDPEPHYELYPHEFKFAFALSSGLDTNSAIELSRSDLSIKSEKITERYTNPSVERIIQMFACDL